MSDRTQLDLANVADLATWQETLANYIKLDLAKGLQWASWSQTDPCFTVIYNDVNDLGTVYRLRFDRAQQDEDIDDEDGPECEYPEWFSEVHITNHLQRKRPAGHQQPIAS